MIPLHAAAALARALPCPATRGALYGLCEREAARHFGRGITARVATRVLYRRLLGQWRRGDGARIGRALGADRSVAGTATYRLRQAGVLDGTRKS